MRRLLAWWRRRFVVVTTEAHLRAHLVASPEVFYAEIPSAQSRAHEQKGHAIA